VLVIDDEQPRAFCAGLLRPRTCISTGALAVLDDAALAAVLTHEAHHARRRDPLRLAVGRVLSRALFFVPGLTALTRSQRQLAELSADERAAHGAPEGRSALARAMLAFCTSPDSVSEVGIDADRIDHLLGEPPSWRFPAAVCVAALAVIVLVLGVAILAGRSATGSASLAPPLLSAQPCIVVLALIPAGVAAVIAGLRRTART
jgi:beta-lactamase regulating signal transducer with metallopeptidase domain